ncbi:hypothetical protein JR316_0009923 [Psilocybe cubensis]|uniref:Uncharacterized protein n=2 Tax=Psilocybe cubensis TaxID=181762 RepID=A0ACB8GQJ2_PSICU|nr:hypothetical protein JR316_0009923 [Psilocybe cubensis]KAH9477697.1 hypothetical protein JR316_0009923 [Psilocybe cubensis]
MSTESDSPFFIPQNIQIAAISGNLNAVLVSTLLTGFYSVVYLGTMYLYISRMPTSQGKIVILSAISLLYALCLVQQAIQWYYINLILIFNGDTRLDIFFAVLERGSVAVYAVFQFSFCFIFVVSDALLIWRCYHVWGKSFKIIILPLALILGEMGLSLAVTLVPVVKPPTFTSSISSFKNLTSIQTLVSFGTTAICTFLIGLKIHKASHQNFTGNGIRSTKRLGHIIKIIVESAAVYSLVTLVYAIQGIIPFSPETIVESPLLVEGLYMQVIIVAVAGLAPTVIAARIALSTPKSTFREPTTRISDMIFPNIQGTNSGGTAVITNIRC